MASATISGRVTGLEDLVGRMHGIKRGIRNKLLRKATSKAGRAVRKIAKANCPVNTDPHLTVKGLMKKSMGLRVKATRSGAVVGVIGPRKGFKAQVGTRRDGRPIFQDPAKIAHLVEYGHGGPHPAPPHPFMRPAWDSGATTALAIYRDVLGAGLAELGRGGAVDDGGSAD